MPLIVIVLEDQLALTPGGKPFAPVTPAFEILVAPVIAWVILVNGAFTHKVGVEDAAPTVLAGVTVIVPVAFTLPQPPVNGIV